MFRVVIALGCLAGACWVAAGDDKIAVREKLFAAKAAYDMEIKQYRKSAAEWFDTREEAARKDGNKKLVDQIKAERAAFDEAGVLPKGVPAALPQKATAAKKALETAYGVAVKEYTKAKADGEAAAVEKEWKEFAAKANAINLLALVDPKTHAVSGEWKQEGQSLVGSQSDKPALLQLPYEPAEEYDLELVCRRVAGNEGLDIGLVAGGRQVSAVIDGWPADGYRSGLELVDKKRARDNVTTVKGGFFKAETDSTIICSVQSGKIDLSVNGKVVTSFKGSFTRLSPPEHWRGPNKKALYLGFFGGITFDRIVVTQVKGKGTVLK